MDTLYQKLHGERSELRLLTIQVTDDKHEDSTRDLNCTLSVHSLQDAVDFAALSYVWGDVKEKNTVYVNHVPISVTANLYVALTTLRGVKDAATGYLWIDAICINQQDLDERTTQVKMMRKVYTRATKVIIWLGPMTKNAALFLAMLRNYKDRAWPMDLIARPAAQQVLQDVFAREYWGRAWVLQEAALAREAVAFLGPYNVPFWDIVDALWHVTRSAYSNPEQLGMIRNGTSFLRFHTARECAKRPSTSVLLDSDRASASDSRDLVYGLLALTPASLGIEPVYTIPVEDVFSDTTLAMITHDGTLEHLLLAGTYDGKRAGLGSWVLDFGNLSLSVHKLFNACGGMPEQSLYVAHGSEKHSRKFIMQALIVDEVDDRGEAPGIWLPPSIEGPVIDLRIVLNQWRAWAPQAAFWNKSSLAFWRTVHGDNLHNPPEIEGRWTSDDEVVARKADHWIAGGDDDKAAKVFDDFATSIDNYRVFFATTRGRLAIIDNRHVQAGDVVAIAVGAPAPLVLRKIADAGPNEYQLVGGCYCDGIMYGEAVREAALLRNGDESNTTGILEHVTLV